MSEPPRREPVFDPERRSATSDDAERTPNEPTPEPPARPRLDPAVRFALYAVGALCLFVLAERIIDRYHQRQALQVLTEQLELVEESFEQMSEEQAARVREQRRQRAGTTTGQWLAKNCADWTRSYDDMPTETGRAEKQKHCTAYRRYLASGVVPSGAPR